MDQIALLKRQRNRLKEDIATQLEFFLIGTIAKSPSMTGHGLTTKVKGRTVSLYVRKDIVKKATEMTKKYKMLWLLIRKLSALNFEILKLEHE
jgi:hypothetical protein